MAHLGSGATEEIYNSISKTADAYQEASTASSSSSAAAHARFLRTLIANDNLLRPKQSEKERHPTQPKVRYADSRYPR